MSAVNLGRVGVWWSSSRPPKRMLPPEVAHELEELGFGSIWLSGGFAPGLSPQFAQLLQMTDRVTVASGIVNIWSTPPHELAGEVAALETAHPGRFLLGLGASHAALIDRYERPYSHMVAYLDALDAAVPSVVPGRRMLAALRSRMLELAGARAAGAHPYFVPVEHTRRARRLLGPEPILAPEVTAVIERDANRARALARSFTTRYLALPNYTNNLRSLGFDDADVSGTGSDRLVDAVVAWGDANAIAGRVQAHHNAGADHVCVQLLSAAGGFPLDGYRALAEALR